MILISTLLILVITSLILSMYTLYLVLTATKKVVDIQRIKMGREDVGVLKIKKAEVSSHAQEGIRSEWKKLFPQNKLIILLDDIEFGVLNRESEEFEVCPRTDEREDASRNEEVLAEREKR